jgi:hypothetical protein
VLPLGFTAPPAPGVVTSAAAPVGNEMPAPPGGNMPVVTTAGCVVVVMIVGVVSVAEVEGLALPVTPVLLEFAEDGAAAVVMTGPAPPPASPPPHPPNATDKIDAAIVAPGDRNACATQRGPAADAC